MKQTKKQKIIWFIVAFVAVLLAAPNNTFLKSSLHEIGPLWISFIRFTTLAVVLLPALYFGRKSLNERGLNYSVIAGVAYAVAVMSMGGAIFYSQASYPALIGISSPILMMFYSVWLTREKVSHKSFFGITVAAVGGFLIIFLSILFSGSNGGGVSPVATILALLNAAASPLMYVMTKKAVDTGMSIQTSLSAVALTAVAIIGVVLLGVNPLAPTITQIAQPGIILPIIYSVIGAMLLARGMTTIAFKRLGSASIAGLDYLGVLLAVLVPVLALGERLTIEMAIGGGLILAGVIAIERKYSPKWMRKRKQLTKISSHSVKS